MPSATAIATGQSDLALIETAGLVPTILGSPTSKTVAANSSVSLFGFATGYGTLHFQWFFNGTNAIVGGTKSFLYLTNLQVSQSGSYSFSVSNAAGSSYSQPALLTVLPSLEIEMAPAIKLFGRIGSVYRLEYVNAIGAPGQWTEVVTLTVTNNSTQIFRPSDSLNAFTAVWNFHKYSSRTSLCFWIE
jgi:hypothetical protein